MPDLMDFLLYCFYNQIYKADKLGMSKKYRPDFAVWAFRGLEYLRRSARKAFEKSSPLHAAQPDPRDRGQYAKDDRLHWAIRPVKAGS